MFTNFFHFSLGFAVNLRLFGSLRFVSCLLFLVCLNQVILLWQYILGLEHGLLVINCLNQLGLNLSVDFALCQALLVVKDAVLLTHYTIEC